jgi:hypothetical protein
MSAGKASARWAMSPKGSPAAAMASRSASSRRPAKTTRQPSSTRRMAEALPMPLPAPVINAMRLCGSAMVDPRGLSNPAVCHRRFGRSAERRDAGGGPAEGQRVASL